MKIRPKKLTVRVTTVLTPAQEYLLWQYCYEQNVSISQAIRDAIDFCYVDLTNKAVRTLIGGNADGRTNQKKIC